MMRKRYSWQSLPFETFFTDDLRKAKYRGCSNPYTGHCYVASEVLFHLDPGRYHSYFIVHENEPHWFLKDKFKGEIIDPTYKQFKTPVPYDKGIRKGFLTKSQSKRARQVIENIKLYLVELYSAKQLNTQGVLPLNANQEQQQQQKATPK